jgi:type II secretion system protein N
MTSKRVVIPIAIGLILIFVLLLFPWESLARRVAWEVSAASGGRVEISTLAPALTARGPVLRARNVLIEHPAIDRIRLIELELGPRRILQWLSGVPTLRIWTTSELGILDGVLGLGTTLSFVGTVHQVELARLPLRLDASGVDLSGQLDGVADITLAPDGTLHGRMTFDCVSLVVASNMLPMAIPFTRAEGVIEILESGATRIESLSVEGDVLEGRLSGEIGLVHHSQSPPIDLNVKMRIVDAGLRQLAPGAGIPMSTNGELDLRISGTFDRPRFDSSQARPKGEARPARANRRERNR